MPTKSKRKRIRYGTLGGRLGRPPKPDSNQSLQVTCVLKRDTVLALRSGAASKHFGEFLQHHLDRYPPPTREEYLAMQMGPQTAYYTMVKRRKRIPTLMGGSLHREDRKAAKEQARRERLTPAERAWEDSIRDAVTQSVRGYDGNHQS